MGRCQKAQWGTRPFTGVQLAVHSDVAQSQFVDDAKIEMFGLAVIENVMGQTNDCGAIEPVGNIGGESVELFEYDSHVVRMWFGLHVQGISDDSRTAGKVDMARVKRLGNVVREDTRRP